MVSCEFDVELLQGHFGEVVFAVFDPTFAQKVQEGVTVTVWQAWVTADFD